MATSLWLQGGVDPEAAEEARQVLGEHRAPLRAKAELGDPFRDVEGKADFLKKDAPLLEGGQRPPTKLPALLKPDDKQGMQAVPEEDLGQRTARVGKARGFGASKELKVLRRPVKEMNEHLEKLRENIKGMMAEKSSLNAQEIGKTLEYADIVRTARVMGGVDTGVGPGTASDAAAAERLGQRASGEEPSTSGRRTLKATSGLPTGEAQSMLTGKLDWVQDVISFTENFPIYFASENGADVQIEAPKEAEGPFTNPWQFVHTVFPGPRPGRREDIYLLEHWLNEMLRQVPVDKVPQQEGTSALETADRVLRVYQTAFDELERHLSCFSKDAGQLLQRMRYNFFHIFEMREHLRYQQDVRELALAAQHIYEHAQEVESRAKESQARASQGIETADLEKKAFERDAARLAKQLAQSTAAKRVADKENVKLNQRLLQEVTRRLSKEDELSELAQLLEKEFKIHKETGDMRDQYLRELNEKKIQLAEVQNELQAAVGVVEEQEKTIGDQVVQLTAIKVDIASVNSQMESEVILKETSIEEIGQLKVASAEKEALIRNQAAELMKLKEAAEKSAAELQSLQQQLQSSQNLKGKLEEEHSKLRKEHIKVTARRDQLEGTLERERSEQRDVNLVNADELKRQNDRVESLKEDIQALHSKVRASNLELGTYKVEQREVADLCREFAQFLSPDGSGEDDVSRARDEDWQRKGSKGMVQHSINLILKHIGVLAKTLRETERRQVVAQTRFQAEEDLRRKGEKKVYEEKARNEKIIRELNTASSESIKYKQSHADALLRIGKLERELESSKTKFDKVVVDNKTLSMKCVQLDECQRENASLSENLNHHIAQLERAQHDRTYVEKQLLETEAENKRSIAEINQLTQMRNNLANKVDFMGTQAEKKDAELASLKQTLKITNQRNDAERSSSSADLAVAIEERDKLQVELDSKKANNCHLRLKLAETRRQLGVAQFVLKGLSDAEENRRQREMEQLAEEHPSDDEEIEGEDVDGVEKASSKPIVPLTMMRAKIAILSTFCNKLRVRLQEEQAERMESEKEWLETAASWESNAVKIIQERVDFERTELKDLHLEVQGLHSEMGLVKESVGELCTWGIACGTRLKGWEDRHKGRKDTSNMVLDAVVEPWLKYIHNLPPGVPANASTSLEKRKIIRVICQAYAKSIEYRQSESAVGGDIRQDTIFDTVLSTFRQVYGHFDSSPAERNMADFLCSLRAHQDDLKILTFSKFTGIAPEFIGVDHYHFFLSVLECTRRLLGVNWRTVMQEWDVGNAGLPVPCMMDVLANLYNTNNPGQLPVVQRSLKHIMKEGKLGPSVDLDSFLATLLKEFGSTQCPVAPMLAPRRISSDTGLVGGFNI